MREAEVYQVENEVKSEEQSEQKATESRLETLEKQYEQRQTQLKSFTFQETRKLEEKQKESEELGKLLEEQKIKHGEIKKNLETYNSQETWSTQKIEELNEGIRKLTEAIQHQESELKSFSSLREQKEKERTMLQDEADAYALVKYLSYLNIYSALPNGDFDYHKFKDQGYELSTLSPFALPLTLDVVNKRASTVGAYNAREAVKRETDLYISSNAYILKETLASDGRFPLPATLNTILKENTFGAANMPLSIQTILNAVGKYISSQTLSSSYLKRPETDRYNSWSQPLNLEEADLAPYNESTFELV